MSDVFLFITNSFRMHDQFCSFYGPQTKLRKGNVFTPVCQSFHSQGGVPAPVHAGIHTPPGRHPRADTPLGRPLRQTPPGQTPLRRADTP